MHILDDVESKVQVGFQPVSMHDLSRAATLLDISSARTLSHTGGRIAHF